MRTHRPSKRGSMEEEDRLSSLPDDLLHSILRGLPLKHAARTSALSRRWAPLWLRALAASKVLDFTDRNFARGQPPARALATVRRLLELHAEHGAPLDVFRVALTSPPAESRDGAFGRDVVGWIVSTVARGAREVAVDLTPTSYPAPTSTEWDEVQDANDGSEAFVELPGDLFVARNSLARLALGGFSLHAVLAAPAGLAGLRSLSLSHANFTSEALSDVVSSCRALEHLSLSSCDPLKSIRIASETLRALEIVRCRPVRELRVRASALESLAFHDDIFLYVYIDGYLSSDSPIDLGSTPALRDAYLSQISFGHKNDDSDDDDDYELCGCDAHPFDYAELLSSVAHAPVCTLSSNGWFQGNQWELGYTNIQELQLLVAVGGSTDDLEGFARLFEQNRLRLLDRLFVRFPGHITVTDAERHRHGSLATAGKLVDEFEIEEFVLDSLSFIKMVNFRGTWFELLLLDFFLKRAPVLEHLVLVTVGEEGGAPGPGDDEHLELEVIQRYVSAMRKASPDACLTVCRSSQDRSQNPLQTRLYDEE